VIDKRIIEKVADLVKNLRALGFSEATIEDIHAATGQLVQADLKALGEVLAGAGATRQGRTWSFSNFDVDKFTRIAIIKVVGKPVAISTVEGGQWQKDHNGHWRFIKCSKYQPATVSATNVSKIKKLTRKRKTTKINLDDNASDPNETDEGNAFSNDGKFHGMIEENGEYQEPEE
jgi:hypothetical protein